MYEDIINKAIDLHVHIGPEIVPRKYTLSELVKAERSKLKGVGVKNHFFPTVVMNTPDVTECESPFVINSLTLNHYVGGFNAAAVRASAELSTRPIIVWFPTTHAANMLQQQDKEIPSEWLAPDVRKKLKLRDAASISGLSVLDDSGKIKQEVKKVLKAIKENDAIFATGHLSWQESQRLVTYAIKEIRIKRVIVTHPIYQKIAMPIEVQKDLAELGAFMEQCFSMYSIDEISVEEIAEQIKTVGADSCIMSSDVGQEFSKTPSAALAEFCQLLEAQGVSQDELSTMLVENPVKLVG